MKSFHQIKMSAKRANMEINKVHMNKFFINFYIMLSDKSEEIRETYLYYKNLEQKWYKNLEPSYLDLLTDRKRVSIKELHLYGEVGFLLLGYKSSVLIEHIPKEKGILNSYIDNVCEPFLNHIDNISLSIFGFFIEEGLQFTEMDLSGSYLLVNKHHEHFNIIEDTFLNGNVKVEEDTLAKILDYPGSLPKRTDEYSTMIRVGYIEKSSGYWLTTFAAQKNQLNQINDHFLNYCKSYKELFGLDLHIIIEDLS